MDQSDAATELAFIKKAIADSRQVTFDYGLLLIFWGIATVVGLCLSIVVSSFPEIFGPLLNKGLDRIFYIWVTWAVVIGVFTVLYLIKRRKRVFSLTYVGRIVVSSWVCCGVLFVLISLIGFRVGAIRLWAICPVNSAIFGIGLFMTGIISSQKWCRNLGFCWWIGALFFFWLGDTSAPVD